MISVIMSVYNEKLEWIQLAYESIMNQSYQDIEFIIVVDNPKIDKDTMDFLERQVKEEKRVVLIKNETNMGLAESLNRGIEIAKGDYIARMDADDISNVQRLEKELAFLRKTGADLVSTNKKLIDEDGKIIGKDPQITREPKKTLKYGNFINHSSVLIKTTVIKECGGYRHMRNSEDYDLWLRMIDKGYKLSVLDEYLLDYRVRENSASIERQLEQHYMTQYLLKCHKERVKTGEDSFSEIDLKKYMDLRNINEKTKTRFANAVKCLENAIEAKDNKKLANMLGCIIRGLTYEPIYVISRIIAQIKMR